MCKMTNVKSNAPKFSINDKNAVIFDVFFHHFIFYIESVVFSCILFWFNSRHVMCVCVCVDVHLWPCVHMCLCVCEIEKEWTYDLKTIHNSNSTHNTENSIGCISHWQTTYIELVFDSQLLLYWMRMCMCFDVFHRIRHKN